MTITVVAAGQTDLGQVRKNNEDAFLVARASSTRQSVVDARGVLLAVCDGMGGELAGEVASAMGLEVMHRRIDELLPQQAPHDALRTSIEAAHAAVHADALRNLIHRGMGATLTVALIHGDSAFIGEVGDSRAYLIRAGRIIQITHDQSYVQVLLDSKAITQEQAADFPYKNVILQAVGKEETISVALTQVSLRRDDRLLLCSDGLSNMLSDDEMLGAVDGRVDLVGACAELVRIANQHGADDNVTVVCALVSGDLPVAGAEESVTSTFSVLSEFGGKVASGVRRRP